MLDAGDKLKVTVMFRGRESSHPELARKLLQRMADTLKDIAYIERNPAFEGNRMHIIMAPGTAPKPAAPKPAAPSKPVNTENKEKEKEEVKKT